MNTMPTISPTAAILTLGCKVNQYESEALAEALTRAGFVMQPSHEACDLYILNSCTVTAESDRKSRQAVRRLLSQNPNAYMIVTGCSAETGAQRMADIQGVDVVLGNKHKMKAVTYAQSLVSQGYKNQQAVLDVPSLEDASFEAMTITSFVRTRAYVKIQDGCVSKCTYCTIPKARGPLRSKPLDDVVAEVTYLTKNGCAEVVLTGIETGAWGKDLGREHTLASLLVAISHIEGIGRVRLGSLDPTVITEEFAQTVSQLPCVTPHFHLSMQSGCAATLARMKRKYNPTQAMAAMERLRRVMPQVQFTTDIIVGFPGETEEEFAQTLAFVKEAKFLQVHAFPYSKRAGTPAAVMEGQVDEAIKKQRVHMIADVAKQTAQEILQSTISQGQPVSVLFETRHPQGDVITYRGHTPSFMEVEVCAPSDIRGLTYTVIPTHTAEGMLYGKLATSPLPCTLTQGVTKP